MHILAGGRHDPFNVFCVGSSPHDQKVFEYAIHNQWSHFDLRSNTEDVKSDVMSRVVHMPVSYRALLYAGACHAHFWNKSATRTTERDPELLRLKLEAIGAMRQAIQQSDEATEDVLIGVFMLAACDAGDRARRAPRSKVMGRKSLLYTGDSEFWVALAPEQNHLKVLYELLDQRGGARAMPSGVLRTAVILWVYTSIG